MAFRSEEMVHYQLIIPREIAWDVTNELGGLAIAHLEDVSDPMTKPFTSQIKRCDESLYKISLIINFMKKKNIIHQQYQPELDGKFVYQLLQKWQQESKSTNTNPVKRINTIEQSVEQSWNSYQELTQRLDKLTHTLDFNKGKMAVFAAARNVFGGNYFGARRQNNFASEQGQEPNLGLDLSGLSYIISVIKPQEEHRISKMVFRMSRGYAWTNFVHGSQFRHIPELADFSDTVLILFYPNSAQGTIQKKLQRIVDSFSVEKYKLPGTQAQFGAERGKMQREHIETNELLKLLNKQIDSFLNFLKDKRKLDEWQIFFTKQKALYEALNKMQVREQFLVTKFYTPKSKIQALSKITQMAPTPILDSIPLGKPPSYFQTNLFTYPGQQIVETYGVPRYEEMNPGIFTCITFPFLFGVMFGDIAHGFVLLMFGVGLVFMADTLKTTALRGLLQVRYMVLLMGFFAMYCGFIYNDFMGIGLNLFGSCYSPPMYGEQKELVIKDPGCAYPFGVDPIWYRTQNELMFMNSLKMKLAVIIGVIHMSFGIILKAVNSLHFRKTLDFVFEFIPQITFMVLMFGYMDFLIVFKWLKYWPADKWVQAPSIITTLINLPLKLGKTTYQFGGRNMWGNSPDDTSQNMIQLIILLISVACIPLMLIPKPWIEISRMKKHRAKYVKLSQRLQDVNMRQSQAVSHFEPLRQKQQSEEQHHQPSEIIVHQIIETIQFVLGCISNTASYLRLWALSLAHSQLSQVFFNKTIQFGFENGYGTIAMLIIGFYALAYVTFGVLLCMDTMECFLHALRLHWVQFQNKFFKADGVKFVSFSFKDSVEQMKESQS